MYKKGVKLDEAGMKEEATVYYIDALKRKATNVDAQIALKKTGQIVLDDYISQFHQESAMGQTRASVYTYLKAEEFVSQVQDVGVKLEIDYIHQEEYKKVLKGYLKDLYTQAQNDFDQEAYASAEAKLKEIATLYPDYENVDELRNLAYVIPAYKKGLGFYDEEKYRKAYAEFSSIEERGGYRDSKDLMDICIEKGQYTIGLMKFENKSRNRGVEEGISSAIVRDIMNLNDPFLKVIDRRNTEALLKEQELAMTGTVSQQTAAKAGELLGAKAVLNGSVVSSVITPGKLNKSSRPGWLAKKVKYKDSEGKTKTRTEYSKVYYYEYVQTNEVNIVFQYQIISSETGQILVTDIIEETQTDKINYATFPGGDTRNLYSGQWTAQNKKNPADKVFNSYSAKRNLDRMLSASQTIQPTTKLLEQAYETIGIRVANKVKSITTN
ncbi:MAG: hypothetical protein SchgKO_09580 [Schleiferiaceae bacterium]